MNGYRRNDRFELDDHLVHARRREAWLWIFGLIGFLLVSIALDNNTRLKADTTFRLLCIGICQYLIYTTGRDFRGERWPRIGFWAALVVNFIILVSPLTDRPASRGELMVFAPADAVVVLWTVIASYKVTDVHTRAVRQQMILGLVVAVLFVAILSTLTFFDPRTGHSWGHLWSSPPSKVATR